MPIPIYNTNTINAQVLQRLMQRSAANYDAVKTEVKPNMEAVKQLGDIAILNKYGDRGIPIRRLVVSKKEFDEAYQNCNSRFLQAFKVARRNLENVCKAQMKSAQNACGVNGKGIKVWREWRPLDSVGIYAPGGRANYPSTLLMCAIPAIISGCNRIITCAPPNEQGKLPAELLVSAAELGVTEVFKVGGAQAVAAMAYGTESIPKVLKIVGPGNQYVTAAKLLVFPQTAIDLPAGPSENLIIADDSANPAFVAADLITDAEHGPDSASILLTPSELVAKNVVLLISNLIKRLATQKTIKESLANYGAIIVTQSLDEAISLANAYAPEHMQIMAREPESVAKRIINAGSVFVGTWSAKAAGDYTTGANHVLPTGQAAKSFGALSVESFGKWIEFQKLTEVGFLELSKVIETYADIEALPAHKLSSTVRINK
jgi:histidinol dehydrogenase